MKRSYATKLIMSFALLFVCSVSACGGSSFSTPGVPSRPQTVQVRFVDGAPDLKALVAGVPQPICAGTSLPCDLSVNGKTVSEFFYGYVTTFVSLSGGTLSLVAFSSNGNSVGPIKTNALSPGNRYTVIIAGNYPNYRAYTFAEPTSSSDAELSLYEASTAMPQASFGSFRASSNSNYKQLGIATIGKVTTVNLGKSVTDFGGYVGSQSKPINKLTPSQADSFDSKNALPFNAANRFSLFLLDGVESKTAVFGSLDQ